MAYVGDGVDHGDGLTTSAQLKGEGDRAVSDTTPRPAAPRGGVGAAGCRGMDAEEPAPPAACPRGERGGPAATVDSSTDTARRWVSNSAALADGGATSLARSRMGAGVRESAGLVGMTMSCHDGVGAMAGC